MSELLAVLQQSSELMIVQKREIAELFGLETRNKYAIEVNGAPLGFAAEQGKGGLAFFARMFFGHWRTFEIHFFDAVGRQLGAIQQRFAFLWKRFDVTDPSGRVLLTVSSPIWRPWTFVFTRDDRELARVEKKWSGMLQEAFTDADRFRVAFDSPELNLDERSLVLAAGIFIDLQYFERKAQ